MATILLANFSGDHLMRLLDPRTGIRLGRSFRRLATQLSRPGGDPAHESAHESA
ncbi:hypothetical protein [Kribbella sp. NPDC048915]|uniref:hypothetical protein n=1 Tax=Kribbella sp. NPDC048915 TaxID=3155148 RepID=UPI0033CDD338